MTLKISCFWSKIMLNSSLSEKEACLLKTIPEHKGICSPKAEDQRLCDL